MAEIIAEQVQPLRAAGAGDLACDLFTAGLATQDEQLLDAAIRLMMHGIVGADWRKRLAEKIASLPQPYDIMREIDAKDRMVTGASARQAAEQTAAKFGGHASFDSAQQIVRTLAATDAPHEPMSDEEIAAGLEEMRCWAER